MRRLGGGNEPAEWLRETIGDRVNAVGSGVALTYERRLRLNATYVRLIWELVDPVDNKSIVMRRLNARAGDHHAVPVCNCNSRGAAKSDCQTRNLHRIIQR